MNSTLNLESKSNASNLNSQSSDSLNLTTQLLEDSGLPVHGTLELPERDPVYAETPAKLHRRVREIVAAMFPAGLYSHQSLAIAASLDGEDVCQGTSTASVKSLVFMARAMHELLQDPHARVLVFYPARALIQDQLAKWSAILDQIGLQAGFIDGGVPASERNQILLRKRVVLMTPDVAQAWLMSHLNDPGVAAFRKNLRLLILDEAHVYDGVFGTNMAFFLRRLQAVAAPHRLMCSTATLGTPEDFIYQLTGRRARIIGPNEEGGNPPGLALVRAWSTRSTLLSKLRTSRH
jgi:DEAD/DEAH box helicase domain-containing protein